MELTISEIQEKRKNLKDDLLETIYQFHKETGLKVKGEVKFGFTGGKLQHYISLEYSNPFQ